NNNKVSKDLLGSALEFNWRSFMPLNKIKRLKSIIKILSNSILTSCFYVLIKCFNPFKYKHNALNGHQFFKAYYKLFFEVSNFDIIHIHFGDNAVHLLNQLQSVKSKIIVTFHGYDANKFNSSF